MADDAKPRPSSAPEVRNSTAFSGSVLPYVVAALMAATAMAWYFFIFVPAKMNYFVGLRFRTLAVAAGHVKSKADNLAQALNVALAVTPVQSNTPITSDDLKNYFRLVVPEIQNPAIHGTEAVPCGAGPQGLDICAHGDRTATAQVAWTDIVAQAAAASRADFDDLILANDEGNVLWQREISTPRIGNLSELLAAPDETGGLLSFSWRSHATVPVAADKKHLVSTATLKHVHLGGTPHQLLVQAISVMLDGSAMPKQPAMTLYVGGLVSEATLQSQAMQIPVVWLVGLTLPVALLFMALPFLKLATLMPKERYAFADIVGLMIATLATAGLGIILPLLASSSSSADATLGRLTKQVRANFQAEAINILQLADGIRATRGLQPSNCEVAGSGTHRALNVATSSATSSEGIKETGANECKLWDALSTSSVKYQTPIELDVAIWFDDDGDQVQKWTTKVQITGRAKHRSFQHFRDLKAGHLWKVSGHSKLPAFTIEPLRAPTTSELGVVFALAPEPNIPQATKPALRLAGDVAPNPAPPAAAINRREFFGVNVRPQSVVDPVVPPGYGFAILAPDGKVLFHSQEGLSLEENFFEEVGDPVDVRAKAQSGRPVQWSGDYHGRPHRIRMDTLGIFEDCPWLIVAFQEMQPALDAEVLQHSGTFRLGLVNLGLLTLLALAAACYFRYKQRRSRDLMQGVLATGPGETRHLIVLAVLAILEVVAIASTYFPATYPRISWIYAACFVAIPVAALVTCITMRCKAARTSTPSAPATPLRRSDTVRTRRWSSVVSSPDLSLALLLIVVGVLPAIGFVFAVQVVQDSRARERWIDTVERGLVARQARVTERTASNYTPETRAELTAQLTPAAFASIGTNCTEAPYSYLSVLASSPVTSCPGRQNKSWTATGILPAILDWNFFDAIEERGTPPRAPSAVLDALTTIAGGSDQRQQSWIAWWLGGGIVLWSFVGVRWARGKVLPRVFAQAPDLDAVVRQVNSAKKGGIVLLIGPPRTGKDEMVSAVIKKVTHAEPTSRLRLIDVTLTDNFIRETRLTVDRAIGAPPRASDDPTIWVHVSNLEAQLVDETSRAQILRLIAQLLDSPTRPVALIITSSVDPVAHFTELFDDERRNIYADHVPEIALSTAALLLSRSRRCFIPLAKRKSDDIRRMWERWRKYKPSEWKETLQDELSAFPPLKPIYCELTGLWHKRNETATNGVPLDELLRGIRAATLPFYELLWTSCTRDEKLVLIQLAQEGFITAQCWDVAAPLVAKGLIVNEPFFAIFNRTFRDFLIDIERNEVIQQWERTEGRGLWVTAGRLIGSSVVAGGIFYLLTQDVSVQSLIPVVSGTGLFGTPIVRSFLARFSAKGGPSAA